MELSLREIETNGLSVIALATRLGNKFEAQGQGCLAVIGSVAGDRGRQSNYVYGAAKGMVAIFLQGLRNRLAKKACRFSPSSRVSVDTIDDRGVCQERLVGEARGNRSRDCAGHRSKK